MHRGLAAGCVVSSMCCNLYYGDLENNESVVRDLLQGWFSKDWQMVNEEKYGGYTSLCKRRLPDCTCRGIRPTTAHGLQLFPVVTF